MDTKVSQNEVSLATRRMTRQSSNKDLHVELKPRAPLKRTKWRAKNQSPAVNGSKEFGTDDDESPSKKSRLEAQEARNGGDHQDKMDIQEMEQIPEKRPNQDVIIEEDFLNSLHQQKMCSVIEDANLEPRVLFSRCQSSHTSQDMDDLKTKRDELLQKIPVISTKSTAQCRLLGDQPPGHCITSSMAQYKEKMEAKAQNTGLPKVNHYVTMNYPSPDVSYATRRVSKIPAHKPPVPVKKQEANKSTVVKSTSESSSKGFSSYSGWLALLLLLSSAALLAYRNVPLLQGPADGEGYPSMSVKVGKFAAQMSVLESRFPSQHPELWRRSRIHLERHLQTAQPREPASLMLTAGRKGERTLRCLAQGLASAFSSALNASALHIDGASMASQDSDQVKLDIDSQLRGAFEANKPVAVIHRFEALPPGSTLIFYRYCDHENAAYKRVFLAFTVLLPQEDMSSQLSLKYVEELVQDYIKDRFVGSVSPAAFNMMDTDKLSGLWSRISHLVLPVVFESEVEERGC